MCIRCSNTKFYKREHRIQKVIQCKNIFFISQRAFKMRNAKQKKNLKIFFFLNFAVQKREKRKILRKDKKN